MFYYILKIFESAFCNRSYYGIMASSYFGILQSGIIVRLILLGFYWLFVDRTILNRMAYFSKLNRYISPTVFDKKKCLKIIFFMTTNDRFSSIIKPRFQKNAYQ